MKKIKEIMFGSKGHNARKVVEGRLILFLVAFVFAFNVISAQIVSNRYYQVILKNTDGTETKLSQHLTQLTAETKLNCREGYIIPPTNKTLTEPQFKCTITKVTDTIREVMFKYGNVDAPGDAVLDNCRYKYIVKKDTFLSIPRGEFMAEMQRTKDFKNAITTYKLLSTPFYFVHDSIVSKTATTIDIRTFANRTHCILQFVNGVQINAGVYCGPGLTSLGGVPVYRHTHRGLPYDPKKPMIYRFVAFDETTKEILGAIEFSIEASEL